MRGRRGLRPETFEFLGFKHVCGEDRAGRFALIRIPCTKSCRKFLARAREWLLGHRHWKRRQQQQHLTVMLRGLLPVLRLAPLRPQAQLDPPRSPATHWVHALQRRGQRQRISWVYLSNRPGFELPFARNTASDGITTELFANVIWGARCGKSARRVLLGRRVQRREATLGSVRALARKPIATARAPAKGYRFKARTSILLDEWFEIEVRPHCTGRCTLGRFADDAVMAFEDFLDAKRVLGVLGKRFARYGLSLHPDKTRFVDFRGDRPDGTNHPETDGTSFTFLGFTHIWGKSRAGKDSAQSFSGPQFGSSGAGASSFGVCVWSD